MLTPKILALAACCLVVPVVSAHGHKPAPKATHVAARPSRSAAAKPLTKKAAAKLAKAEKPTTNKHKRHEEAPEPAPVKRVPDRHGRLVIVPAPKLVAAVRRPAPIVRRDPDPEPVTEAQPALPEIHVTHNRKVHLAPASGVSSVSTDAPDADQEPRKATPADFLTVDAPPIEVKSLPLAAVKPAVLAKALTPKKIELKTAPLPVRELAKEKEVQLPEPAIVPVLYNKHGRLIMPAAMKGSHDILIHQNQVADRDGLDRIQDDEDLDRMRESRTLVALPAGSGLVVDERLPANRRYARPWTAAFLTVLARAHYARFHTPIQVNSAVRTVEFQQRLMRTNGNAAPAEGETASPHLTGQAVDLAKHGLSLTEIAWLRGYLLPLVQEGKVDVEEEFQQACFHISVYKKYLPQAAPKRVIAPARKTASVLAVAIP